MKYTDFELNSQRKAVYFLMETLKDHLINMIKSNDYSCIYVGKDIEGLDYVSILFGDLYFELFNKSYNSAGAFCFRENNKYQISFTILDDSVDLSNKKQIVELYLYLLTEHNLAVFHELIHYNDACCGLITEDMSSKSDNMKDYINDKMEYHAYLQELLALAEEDMLLNRWNKMNILQRLNLQNKFIENRDKERSDQKTNLYVRYFTDENYKEMIEHAKSLFASHMLDK